MVDGPFGCRGVGVGVPRAGVEEVHQPDHNLLLPRRVKRKLAAVGVPGNETREEEDVNRTHHQIAMKRQCHPHLTCMGMKYSIHKHGTYHTARLGWHRANRCVTLEWSKNDDVAVALLFCGKPFGAAEHVAADLRRKGGPACYVDCVNCGLLLDRSEDLAENGAIHHPGGWGTELDRGLCGAREVPPGGGSNPATVSRGRGGGGVQPARTSTWIKSWRKNKGEEKWGKGRRRRGAHGFV